MAEAYGKLTGKPGLVFVTRGPGATNAAIGIHTAAQDSTPLIAFVGQVGTDMMDREAFQEIDYRQMFGPRRQVGGADRPRRAHSRIRRARVAHWRYSGRPGPVVLALPEDMLTSQGRVRRCAARGSGVERAVAGVAGRGARAARATRQRRS